jgi:hypothetical protein
MRLQRLPFAFTIVLSSLPLVGSARAHDFWLESQGGTFVGSGSV